jgi:DNA-binding transcriptional regulator YhcF (GntR family)
VPLGTQLEGRLRSAIATGGLKPGDRLPSLRHVAAEAGVNVNTVRAVYARLEAAGVITTEQGRGTFVAAGRANARRALREEIARLEAELVRLPAPRSTAAPSRPAMPAGLLSTEELAGVRDDLLARLRELDAARAEVIQRLAHLDGATPDAEQPFAPTAEDALPRESARAPAAAAAGRMRAPTRRSSATLSGARVRWVGA